MSETGSTTGRLIPVLHVEARGDAEQPYAGDYVRIDGDPSALARIEAALTKLPPKLFAVDNSIHDMGPAADWGMGEGYQGGTFTIAPEPVAEGWNTDCGYPGYGLPEPIARAIVDVIEAARELTARRKAPHAVDCPLESEGDR